MYVVFHGIFLKLFFGARLGDVERHTCDGNFSMILQSSNRQMSDRDRLDVFYSNTSDGCTSSCECELEREDTTFSMEWFTICVTNLHDEPFTGNTHNFLHARVDTNNRRYFQIHARDDGAVVVSGDTVTSNFSVEFHATSQTHRVRITPHRFLDDRFWQPFVVVCSNDILCDVK